MKAYSISLGVMLILIGVVVFIGAVTGIGVWFLVWPFVFLIPGAGLLALYFKKGRAIPWLLYPVSVLLGYGFFFIFLGFFSYDALRALWPTFIAIPGLAFFVVFLSSKYKEWGALIPGFIVSALAILFYALASQRLLAIPVMLIAVGAFTLISAFVPRKRR